MANNVDLDQLASKKPKRPTDLDLHYLQRQGISWFSWTLIVLGFNDTSTLVGHFVSSPREREKTEEMKERDREERGTGMKVKKQKKSKHLPSTFTVMLQG